MGPLEQVDLTKATVNGTLWRPGGPPKLTWALEYKVAPVPPKFVVHVYVSWFKNVSSVTRARGALGVSGAPLGTIRLLKVPGAPDQESPNEQGAGRRSRSRVLGTFGGGGAPK